MKTKIDIMKRRRVILAALGEILLPVFVKAMKKAGN